MAQMCYAALELTDEGQVGTHPMVTVKTIAGCSL